MDEIRNSLTNSLKIIKREESRRHRNTQIRKLFLIQVRGGN